jgi:PEP-CTERM motif-containing protein
VGLTGHSFSINYDLDGGDQLDVVRRPASWKGIAMNKTNTLYEPIPDAFSPTTSTFVGSFNSTNGASSTLVLLPAAGAFAGGYTIGSVAWTMKHPLFADEEHISIGFLNPGVDGLSGVGFADISATALFRGAALVFAPEPGTACLLCLGLVGLVVVRRRPLSGHRRGAAFAARGARASGRGAGCGPAPRAGPRR